MSTTDVDHAPAPVAAALKGLAGRDDRALADNRGKRIGILIVAYNAVTTLTQVLKRIRPEVWENVEEVVVFDDASPDATYELAVGYKTLTEIDKLRVIKHQKNLGYGGNQMAGYQYFMDKGFDAVVLLHGDGQYAPEILAHMYHPLVTGEADAVFGSRMMNEFGGPLKGGMPLYKYVGNKLLTRFENRALGMNLTEFHSGYRAYSLAALRQIDMSRMTNDFHFDTEIIVKLNHQGFRIHETPIPTYYGGEICRVNGVRYAKDVARAVHRYNQTVRCAKCHPEFAEYFVHYAAKTTPGSSHDHFQRLVGSNQDVLDVGCGEGFVASNLVEGGNRVTGVDVLEQPKFASKFESYVRADLNEGLIEAAGKLGNRKFDKVLLMDVIEHLVKPEFTLRDCARFLKPNGQLLVSVPNVANISVRSALLFGNFEYTDRGIMDRTHLHFFTRRGIRRFLQENGYTVVRQMMSVIPLERVTNLRADQPMMKLMNKGLAFLTRLMPGLFGYQTILVARARNPVASQEVY